jgi:hypothetical protein
MSVKDTDTLRDGTTFAEFHRDSMAEFTGFQMATKGTNFDKLVKYLDMVTFTIRQDQDEVWRARQIDYAHGLELDDIGDGLNISRDNFDDEIYRFLIKSRLMARTSTGTLEDLTRIAANLLGCEPKDVYMTTDREWVDGQLVGEPNTLKIVDIPYDKVKNMFVLNRLASELERSANGDTHIKFVNFSVPLELKTYVGLALTAHAEMDITVPPDVSANTRMSINPVVGIGLKFDYYFSI